MCFKYVMKKVVKRHHQKSSKKQEKSMMHLFTYEVHGHGKFIWKKFNDLRRVMMCHINQACKHDSSYFSM